MKSRSPKIAALSRFVFAFVFLGVAAASVAAQSAATPGAAEPAATSANSGSARFTGTRILPDHRFWDRGNAWLFSAVAASRTLDYFSTLNMRRRGRQEILLTNDVVDNHAAFAGIEAAATAAPIGATYLFHRSHHHRLERLTSIIHASVATSGAVRNYCLESAHRSTRP